MSLQVKLQQLEELYEKKAKAREELEDAIKRYGEGIDKLVELVTKLANNSNK